ncbi:MAG: hypothetical protein JSW67_06370 [Candidatus Latescibacterota bacterium]|nr:MAG: hypothetical protein JSW67_06370 [Candidatus Latescibacterota bacterium]
MIACGPPQRIDRAPTSNETTRLLDALRDSTPVAWSAQGHARVLLPEGDVEGELRAHVDPPQRARVEIVSKALFGMVGERVVVSLPGDGHVLFYRERSDMLERLPFAESRLADLVPGRSMRGLFALTAGSPPWPRGTPPSDLAQRLRVVAEEDDGAKLDFEVRLEEAQLFRIRLQRQRVERFEWWVGGVRRLEVRYDRWRPLAVGEQPGRLRVRGTDLEAEVVLDRVEPRSDFTARDFEVY